MKKTLRTILAMLMLLNLCTANTFAAPSLEYYDILGNWYGQYTGHSDNQPVERYMNMTVTDCDNKGNFEGEAQVTTVEGQGFDYQWCNYKFRGKMDLENNTFYMKGYKITDTYSGGNWTMIPFDGIFEYNSSGELYVEGIADNNNDKIFYFGRVSEWAKTEITEANMYELIPETLKKKDLSKQVTRAEFAAISVQLYEKLAETEVQQTSTPFIDINGNEDFASIEKAFAVGITVGVSETKFAPSDSITREQLATMLCRTVKAYSFPDWSPANDSEFYLDTSGVKTFADDAYISDYAKPSVYYMTKFGIINGIDETHFAPRNTTPQQEAEGYATATREQAIALSLRIFKSSELWK